MLNLEKIKREIKQQTRNGRQSVYLEVADLNELGYNARTVSDRIFVDVNDIIPLIEKAENNNITSKKHTYLSDIDEKGYHFKVID